MMFTCSKHGLLSPQMHHVVVSSRPSFQFERARSQSRSHQVEVSLQSFGTPQGKIGALPPSPDAIGETPVGNLLNSLPAPSSREKSSHDNSGLVVVDERIATDFQSVQPTHEDLSNNLKDVENSESHVCRLLASLCDSSYALEEDALDDGVLRRKFGCTLVTSSREQTHIDQDAELSPSMVMYQGDGGSPHSHSFHLTRFAHEMPEDIQPAGVEPAHVEPDYVEPLDPTKVSIDEEYTGDTEITVNLGGWHVQVLDHIGAAAQMSTRSMAQFAAGLTQPFWLPKYAQASKSEEQQLPNSLKLNGDICQGWFVCDSEDGANRYFVIQGSINFESWLVNLAFDPVVMLDPRLGVKVHRGVYELAEALYSLFLPLIKDHLDAHPNGKIYFTGHSLGGGVAQVLLLMYVFHGVLLPQAVGGVFAFGNPAIFCEGASGECTCAAKDTCAAHVQRTAKGRTLLETLGLPNFTFRNVAMDRDIVPRAFSCDYGSVRDLMRTWGQRWKAHDCLGHSARPTMYRVMGDLYILAPHVGQSHVKEGYHSSLPQKPGLWRVVEQDEEVEGGRTRQDAVTLLMDNPHPLEILRSPGAYGEDGSISRFHNPRNYARSIGAVLRYRQGLLPDVAAANLTTDAAAGKQADGSDGGVVVALSQ